jgi:predicted TPR repeat methyltransferase
VERLGYCSPALLRAALAPPPAPRSLAVLDLGCGTGLCGAQFRDWAERLVGVDLSRGMLAQAHAKGVYDELILGDLLEPLRAGAGKFDLVLASDVVLYLGDLQPLLAAVYAALRAGGRFAFTVDVLEGADYRLLPFGHYAHARGYLQRAAAAAGLHEVSASPAVFPREGGPNAAGLVVVLARPPAASSTP